MIVEDQPAWGPHLRSKSRLRKAAKRHLADPSLAVAALGATPRSLLEDLELFGFLFESMVVRDLRIYAQAAGAEVLHYRDGTGLEVDAIVQARDGRWGAFEVKLEQREVDLAAQHLIKLRDERVDTTRAGTPAVLGVIVPSGISYLRDDGVGVVSLSALGP
jgi:predicted AAA+ superfamily ATPase